MNPALAEALRARLRGEVRADEPLARHTTLRVGGPAAAFAVVADAADLADLAEVCADHDAPWVVLGRGSNLLVADEGWPGAVVVLGQGFRGITIDGETVEAGGAEPMPGLASEVANAGLGGLEFGIAIPGTLGGAVRMNAGAHGGETREILEWADVARLGAGGAVERWDVDALEMGYRRTSLPADGVVVRARLRLRRVAPETSRAAMAEMRRWRRAHQPLSEPSCGSVFANPDGDSAGRLVDAAGMKGHRVGRARVSEKHANFIVAEPGARAADVRAVIEDVRAAVVERHGVRLRTEVVLVGFREGATT